ncbi:flagellar assembly protein FliH [Halobacillus litoralis]|uniref:flagellar assembly protein FliH n=1 Tax=Halobacillus litoralis TaxID=45668 RepID=UPI001CFE8335|nr:flagellar assembly protein FliH [Halobacillus litoralis]
MTSLSNYSTSTSGRLIQIKQIHHEELSHEQKAEGDLQELELRIKEAEQSLETLEARKLEQVKHAKKEIDAQRKAWEEEKKIIQNEAYQIGFEQGFSKGKEDGLLSYQNKINEANDVVLKAKDMQNRIVKNGDTIILDLALRSAEKISHQKFHQEPETFMPIVKCLVQEKLDQPEIIISVNPAQYGLLHDQLEELQSLVYHHAQLTLYAKDELAPFSCRIESPSGIVDAGIDSQLSELRKKLMTAADEGMTDE